MAAARSGARSVSAVDLSRRATCVARLNGRLHHAGLAVHRDDLFAAVPGRRFGLITANPQYGCRDRGTARSAWWPVDRRASGSPPGEVIPKQGRSSSGRDAGRGVVVRDRVLGTQR
nr:hypothetical protein [Pseudonocardia ammonioxydans]